MSALTRNFSPIGPVVPEIWPNVWGNHIRRKRKKKSSKLPTIQGKIAITTKLQLKFCLVINFGHIGGHKLNSLNSL